MSPLFKLHAKDFLKGLVVAVLSAVFAALQALIQNNGLSLSGADLKAIASVAVAAALAYLTKQLLTTEENKLAGII